MDKISSIIPSNSRVTTSDTKAAGVARAGTASFGRDQLAGKDLDRLHHPDMLNTSTLATERHRELMDQRDTRKDPRAEIVAKMSDKFFASQAKAERPDIRNPDRIESLEGINLVDQKPTSSRDVSAKPHFRAESMAVASSAGEESEHDQDAPMLGHRLDVRA